MEKRGLSHIEVILAFLLFFAAIVTIFYYFSPQFPSHSDAYILSNLYDSIQKNISSDAYFYDISVNNTDGQITQFNGDYVIINASVGMPSNYHIIAKNMSGDYINSDIGSLNGENVLCLNSTEAGNFSFVVLSKDIFNPDPTGSCNINFLLGPTQETAIDNSTYYQLSYSGETNIPTEQKLLDFNQSYYINFQALRSYLNLPSIEVFDFSFTFSNGDVIAEKKTTPTGTEVNSLNRRMEILRKNGAKDYAEVNIRLWQL